LERWVTILMMRDASKNKPLELMRLSLVRSKFSEYVAANSSFKNRKDEVSMMCLFSLLDVLLDMPIEDALEEVPISIDVYNALVHGSGSLKPVCGLLSSYEKGDWDGVFHYADIIQLNPERLYKGYVEAIEWARDILLSME
jgi:EAL and modified HD-GYP domain-containing signal transduction protein